MKLSSRHQFMFSIALVSLWAGFFNYLFFQPCIVLFQRVGVSLVPSFIENNFIRHLLTGYFSDIAWCISLCFITVVLSELNYFRLSGKVFILLLFFITEALQYGGFIKGIFDWYDVLAYGAIILVFILFFPTLTNPIYEKN